MKIIYLNSNGKPERLGILPDSLPDAGAADEMHSPAGTRSQTIPAGTPWKTPVYVAGAHRLEVFLDGLACVAGDVGNAQYSEADNRFHLRLMEETTWPGTGEIIRPYVPAAFYIEHEREYTWSNGRKELITYCVSQHKGGVDYYTQGTATATSSKFNNNSNIFRFKDLGTPETVGIHSVTVTTSQAGADRLYDLSGRRLQTEPTHGVYIKNGRTVVK